MKTEALQSIRTNVHTDLFNRLNHYNSILAAQSQIDNKRQKTYSMISSFNSKRWHEIEKERINLNKKLMNSLGKIDLKYHLYTTIQQCEKKKKKKYTEQSKTLKNNYEAHQKFKYIQQENSKIFKKLVKIRPQIGSKKQWRLRQRKNKLYAFLRSANCQKKVQIDRDFYETYKRLKNKNDKSIMAMQSLKQIRKKQN